MKVTDARRSVFERARQLILFMREFKSVAIKIRDEIDSGSIRAVNLISYQASLSQIKSSIQSWPYGSLTSAEVRAEVVAQFPDFYATPAEVQADIVANNSLFNSVMAEITSVLTAAAANGQYYSSDPITGQEIYMLLVGADVAALRSVVDNIATQIG